VQIYEAYGELKVSDKNNKKAIPSAYVKVFAKKTGYDQVYFFRDGYTDIRGKFEFAPASSNFANIEKFAILVTSETHGAQIREAIPPQVEKPELQPYMQAAL